MANKKLDNKKSRDHFFNYLFEHRVLFFVLLLLPSVVVYYRALNFQFSSLDDQWMIVKSKDFLGSWKSIIDAFAQPIDGVFYRPVLTITYIIDYHIGNGSAAMFHLTNILLHLSTVLLLYNLFLRLGISPITNFILCLWFSIHPLCVSPVAWIPGRNDLLLAVFTFSSLLFLIDFFSQRKWYTLVLHFLFFALAIFTKETAMVLPIIFLAFFLQFKVRSTKTIISFLLTWLLIVALYLSLRTQIVPAGSVTHTFSFASLIPIFKPFIYNVGKIIYPFSQSVLPYNESANWHFGVLSLVLIVYLSFRFKLKNNQTALTGIVLFLLTLIPSLFYSMLTGIDIQFEHRLYLPLAGFLLVIAQINFPYKHKLWQMVVITLLVSSFFTATQRTTVYKNEESFIQAGIAESPNYYLFHMQRGDQLSQKNEINEALHCYDRALLLNNKLPELYNNKAWAFFKLGIFKKAVSNYSKALELDSSSNQSRIGRCMAALQLEDMELVKSDYNFLLKCCPDLISDAFVEKMNALAQRKKKLK